MREKISLECTECKNRNYTTRKNKRTAKEKMLTSKYCKHCRKHTEHKEAKV